MLAATTFRQIACFRLEQRVAFSPKPVAYFIILNLTVKGEMGVPLC
jgi:hypothetical protein